MDVSDEYLQRLRKRCEPSIVFVSRERVLEMIAEIERRRRVEIRARSEPA